MSTPIILICGEAGSGKDTVASYIQQYTKNTVLIAQADPMKRFARDVFGFTEHQLWGPSEARNAPDERFTSTAAWDLAKRRLLDQGERWIDQVLPNQHDYAKLAAMDSLRSWFDKLYRDHAKKTLTPRAMLQTIGTEWGRAVDSNIWSSYALKLAGTALEGGTTYSRGYGLAEDRTKGLPDYVLITDGRFPNEIINAARQGVQRLLVRNPKPSDAQAAVEAAGVKGHASEAFLKQIPQHWYTDTLYNDKSRGLLFLENAVARLVRDMKARTIDHARFIPEHEKE